MDGNAQSRAVAADRARGDQPAAVPRPLLWLRRYAPAEVAALVGAVLAAGAVDRFGLPAATAFAAALGEGIAFYAVLFVRDFRRRHAVVPTLRGLLLEFGPAEVLDTALIRPGAMYLGPLLIGQVTAGVVAGKLAADAVFYTLAIVGHEFNRSRSERRTS